MQPRSDLCAAILAGGRARRMDGANKAALTFGGRTIAERQLDVLREIAVEVLVVGGDPAQWPAGITVVPDRVADAGALGGIYTAVTASTAERVLVVGCDMPFVSLPFLRMLADVPGADVVLPRSERGYEPLCAIYSKACAAGLRARIERGELHAAVRPEGVRVVEIGPEVLAAYDPDGLLLANVNTPHDYERIVSLLRHADRR